MVNLKTHLCLACKMPINERNNNAKYCLYCEKISKEFNRCLRFLDKNYIKLNEKDRWKLLALVLKLTLT